LKSSVHLLTEAIASVALVAAWVWVAFIAIGATHEIPADAALAGAEASVALISSLECPSPGAPRGQPASAPSDCS
jgi:hypothetical protein